MMTFPWPDMRLSGNGRGDRRALTSIRRAARQVGEYLLLEAGAWRLDAVPLQLHLIFHPPDNRWRDDDNMLVAFKPYRDGMFKALGMNDHLIRRTIIEWGAVVKGGAVQVELTELKR